MCSVGDMFDEFEWPSHEARSRDQSVASLPQD